MASAKPSKAPAADLSALVNRVGALSEKAGLGPLPPGALKLPLWKRWVGGEKPEYAAATEGALRVVVDANAKYLDEVKGDVDAHSDRLNLQAARIAALEAQPTTPPFPA